MLLRHRDNRCKVDIAYIVFRLSSATKHRLLHILEGGSNGGHKFHIDRQQNFEIVNDGKKHVKISTIPMPTRVVSITGEGVFLHLRRDNDSSFNPLDIRIHVPKKRKIDIKFHEDTKVHQTKKETSHIGTVF